MVGLLVFCFLAVLSFRLVWKDPFTSKFRLPCCCSLTFHQAAVLCNLYVYKLPGTGADNQRFLREAQSGIDWSNLVGTGAHFYSNGLAIIFKITGRSDLAAFETSILGHALLLMVVVRLVANLGETTSTGWVVWLIALSPSVISYTSTTLREVWQQLFLTLALFKLMELKDNFTGRRAAEATVALVLLGCLQKGLLLYAGVIFIFALHFLISKGGRGTHPGAGVFALVVMLVVGTLSISLIGDTDTSSDVVDAFTDGQILDYAAQYRENADIDRASYGQDLDTSSFLGLLTSVPKLILLYLFSPLPWQLSDPKDMIALVEIWIRTSLAVTGLLAIPPQGPEKKKKLIFLWFAWFILESLWAIGTSNWGTAARHRTVGYPLLCIIASPALPGKADRSNTVISREEKQLSKRQQIRARRQRIRREENVATPSNQGFEAAKKRKRP